MSETTLVRPDLVLTGGESFEPDQPWQALDPCPYCGSHQHDAPEGVNPDGTPRWNFPHCFKCGFRPGVNVAVDQAQMARAFAAFQKYMVDQGMAVHPTLNPPQTEVQTAELQAQLNAANAKLREAGIEV
jgi:hypothetical protein